MMDNINYKNFKNICRTCLLTCEHKFLQDRVISDIYYKLTQTRFELNEELPQQICHKCYEKIIEMHTFSFQCKQAQSSLMKCLEFKNLQINEEDIQETSEGIKEEITIEDHRIEFIKSESIIDELPLDMDDSPSDNMWFTNNSNSNFNIDFIGSEAASMMPLTLVTIPAKSTTPIPTTTEKPNNTFSLKVSKIKQKVKNKPVELENPIKTSQQQQQDFEIVMQNKLVTRTNFSSLSRLSGNEVKEYAKPVFSYSCLIAMALKNSRTGSLLVNEIYNFILEHFPYYRTAHITWKNTVRHNLSLHSCFKKIDKPAASGPHKKGCLWTLNPDRISKMDEDIQKLIKTEAAAIREAMINPDHLEALARGELKYNCHNNGKNEEEQEQEDFGNVNENDEEYDFDIDQQIKIEMDVVDNDLIELVNSPCKKRSRSILELDDNFGDTRIYQVQASTRERTALFH